MTKRAPRAHAQERTRARRATYAALFVVLVVVLTACSGNNNRQNSLHPEGTYARRIDNLFQPIFWIAVVVGVGVVGGTVIFALKFRYREGVNDSPRQVHGSTPLEIGWTVIPVVLLAIISVPTVSTIFKNVQVPKGKALEVTVTGKQWWWQFSYPKQSGIDKTIVTSTELHIPVKTEIRVSLESDNVIHSFWIPELAGKTDVVPGHHNKMNMEADKPGTYLGQCAQYCGLAHADMRMRVIAMTPSDFGAWVANQQKGPAQPYSGEIETLTGQKYGCINCHVLDDSSKAPLAPNLTHIDSRTTFAGGTQALNREDLIHWVMDAPGVVPMQSKDCRVAGAVGCVGMPSFTKHTPKGQPVMTRSDAETIVTYLLGEK